MGLFSKKDKEKKEKPQKTEKASKFGKNKSQETKQAKSVESSKDEMAKLDSQLGIELLHCGYMMIPQQAAPNGEITYLGVISRHAPMFYASDSIASYEQFARKIQEQNGGTPDKVQCDELKNGNYKAYTSKKTTFSEAVKILDSTEAEGFLYLLQDGRGLRLTTRMVRELSRRYSILQEHLFEEEQRRQREEYMQRAQSREASQSHYNSYQNENGYANNRSSMGATTTGPISKQADGRLRQHFENMITMLSNVDAFNMWSANEMYAIGYVMDKMYEANYDDYKQTISIWAREAKAADMPQRLATLILETIVDELRHDQNATDADIANAQRRLQTIEQRSDSTMTLMSFGVVPKYCIPSWCVEACGSYASKKKEELHQRFISACVEQGMSQDIAEKYYGLLSDNKMAMLELDYCLRTSKFKKYGAQKLTDPQTGEMATIEEMLGRLNMNFQENTPQFKKVILAGYIKAVGAARK